MSGKGTRPRPLSIDRIEYENNWNRIFNSEEKLIKEISSLVSEETLTINDEFDNNETKREK